MEWKKLRPSEMHMCVSGTNNDKEGTNKLYAMAIEIRLYAGQSNEKAQDAVGTLGLDSLRTSNIWGCW